MQSVHAAQVPNRIFAPQDGVSVTDLPAGPQRPRDVADFVDTWTAPTPSAPLAPYAYAIDHRASLTHRRKPEPVKDQEGDQASKRIRPTLTFNLECPPELKTNMQALFERVYASTSGFALGGVGPTTIKVHHLDRRRWSAFLANRDRQRSNELASVSSLRALWARLTRWLSRTADTWTTSLFCNKDEESGAGLYLVAENYSRQSKQKKQRQLAEVMVRCLQQASYPQFFLRQQKLLKSMREDRAADPQDYLNGEYFAEAHFTLCMEALEKADPALKSPSSWVPDWLAFWRPRPSPQVRAVVDTLRLSGELEPLFRHVFDQKGYYSGFLFQKGGHVEVSSHLNDKDEALIERLRTMNPHGAPRPKRADRA